MKYIIPIYIGLFFIPTTGFGLYNGCPWYNYFLYSFVHGNIFHLFINMYSLYVLSKVFKNRISSIIQISIFLSIIIGSALMCNTYFSPTYGCSAGVYGMMGYWALSSAWMSGYKTSIQTFSLAIISMLITIPISNINVMLHFTAFAIGCTLATIYSILNNKL